MISNPGNLSKTFRGLGVCFSTDRSSSYTFDLYSAIPYATLDEATRKELWDDGLHLTGQGYKVMGDVIAVRLFEILRETEGPRMKATNG